MSATSESLVMDGWLLAFDSSTPETVVICGRVGEPEPRASFTLPAGANQASERLVDHVVSTVGSAGADMPQITALAVGRGPGTFTGTRVALATAKGMALGLGLPLHPISTLASVAASAQPVVEAGARGIVAVLDARKGEVYAGRAASAPGQSPCDGVLARRLAGEVCITPDHLVETIGDIDDIDLVGPGVSPYATRWPSAWRLHPFDGPTPHGLWVIASAAVRSGATVEPSVVDATYLRASYAELGINVPKRSVWRNPVLDVT